MNITFNLTLNTQLSDSGGTHGSITVFTRELTTHLTGQQFVSWIEQGYVQIEEYIFRPINTIVHDDKSCICETYASSSILQNQDSFEYYAALIKKGWIPNKKDAKAIRCSGYPNFRLD